MKLLFAIKNMSNAKGGAERVLSYVVNGLADKGYEITLLTFDERGLDTFYKIDPRVKRISLGIGKANKKAGFRETLARMRAIRRVVKVRKPDIVIPFMHSMFIPMSFALTLTNVPVLASEHIVPKHYRKHWWEYVLLLISSLFVTKMTVLSHSIKKMYPAFVRRKMEVVPNPVYLDASKITDTNKKSARKIILNVGRLSDQKDHKTLIRAFKKIADKYPLWDIRIAGEGPNRAFLEALIDKLNLRTRVHLIGTTHDIEKEYSQATVFAMPSKYESFGLATAEAMSFGVPAIGFAECPGTNEIIEDGKNGLLVTRGKSREKNFAEALELLMKDEKMRHKFGQKAKKDIVKFQPSLIVKRWEDLILETIKS